MRYPVNTAELAARLREKRDTQGLTLRQAARAAGIPHTTLSRVLRGNHVPDRSNLLLLARWLGVPVEELTGGVDVLDPAQPQQVHPEQEMSTPEAVARLVRADRRLSPADVEMLMLLFRTMYDKLLARNEDHEGGELATPPLTTQ